MEAEGWKCNEAEEAEKRLPFSLEHLEGNSYLSGPNWLWLCMN